MPNEQGPVVNLHAERDQARAQFQITFDANPAPAAIVRLADAVVVKANLGLPELTGRDNHEVEGRSIRELKLFRSADVFEQTLATLKRGESVRKLEIQLYSVTEGVRTAVMSTNPIELGADACGIFTFADVTELKQAEERFFQVFQLVPVPIALLGADDRFLEVNESFEELTGYSADETKGHSSIELKMWSSGDDPRRMAALLGEQGEFRDLALVIRNKAGETHHISGSGKRLSGEHGTVLLHVFYDVTERKRSEEQFHKAIQSVMSDTTWFSRQLLTRLSSLRADGTEPEVDVDFSRREQQVLERLAQGADNEAIARELGLASQTVRNYVQVIYEKLNVHSRAEAIVWARKRGFV